MGAALLVCAPLRALAQLQYTERVISAEANTFRAVNSNPLAVSDNRGGFVVLFKSQRGEAGFANLYLQHVNRDGERQWANAGAPVCVRTNHQNHPGLVLDPRAGIYVCWEEVRPGTTTPAVWVQRLNYRGEPLWQAQALPVTNSTVAQHRPRMVTDREGGVFVVWEEQSSALLGREVYGQRLDSTGRRVWGEGGKPIATGVGDQQNVQLGFAPINQLLVMWEETRTGVGYTLHCQKVNAWGECLWPLPGVPLMPTGVERVRYPSCFGDGFGGLIVAFEALGQRTQGSDVFVVRVNSRGEVASSAPLAQLPYDQLRPQVLQKGSDALVYWEDYQGTDANILAQRFDINTAELAWPAAGKPICQAPGHQRKPAFVTSSVFGNQIVGWLDERAQSACLYAQKVDREGNVLWEANGLRVASAGGTTEAFTIVDDERGGAWFVWTEKGRNTDSEVYYQRVTNEGALFFEQPKRLMNGNGASAYNRLNHLVVATGEDGLSYLAWEDERNGADNKDIYVQCIDRNGTPLWAPRGVAATTAPGNQEVPTLLPLPNGGVIVGWIDRRNERDENLFLQYIDATGHTRWEAAGTPICTALRSQTDLHLLYAGAGIIYAVWTDTRAMHTSGFDLYMQKLDTTSRTHWAVNGTPLVRHDGFQTGVELSADGFGGFWAAWMDERTGSYNIYVQGVRPDGSFRWEEGGRPVAPGTAHQRYPDVALDAQQRLWVVWADDERGRMHTRIKGQLLDSYFYRAWGTLGRPMLPSAMGRQSQPDLVPLPDGSLLLAWLDERALSTEGHQLYVQRMDAAGGEHFRTSGLPVASQLHSHNPFSSLVVGPWVYFAWDQGVGPEARKVFWVRLNWNTGQIELSRILNTRENSQLRPHLVPYGASGVALVWLEKGSQNTSDKILFMPLSDGR